MTDAHLWMLVVMGSVYWISDSISDLAKAVGKNKRIEIDAPRINVVNTYRREADGYAEET